MKSRIIRGTEIALTAIATYWAPVAQAQKTFRTQGYPKLENFLAYFLCQLPR